MKKRRTNRAKQVDSSCRNHGGCPWCLGNRTYSTKKHYVDVDDEYAHELAKPNRKPP